MRMNRRAGTRPELAFRRALRQFGLSPSSTNDRSLPGAPDLTFKAVKLAVFVDGCFWHGCPLCLPSVPTNNRVYWISKFEQNRLRDQRTERALRRLGWSIIRVRQCRLRLALELQVTRLQRKLTKLGLT